MIDYIDYVVVMTEFMCESSCLWIYDFLSFLDIWRFEHEHELMKVMNDLGCLIAMMRGWYVHYNMFDCGDIIYCSIRVIG